MKNETHPLTEEGTAVGEDGTRIHYSVVGEGQGPTLVCCDGIGCDGFAWKYLVRDFARSHRIVRWHYRGHGKSGVPEDNTRVGFADLCGDLAAVIRASGAGRSILVGHSMGVQVALEHHRRHPEQVAGLVLVCGSHGLPLDTFHDSNVLKRAFPTVLAAFDRWPDASKAIWRVAIGGELAYQFATHLEVNGKLVRREDFTPYFRHLSRMEPRVFLGMLKQASEHSALDHLPGIDVPTLIVAGTHDSFTPYWLSEEMHERIPGSELLTIPGGTHVAPIEQPELLTLRLEKWLAAFEEKPAASAPAARNAVS